MAQRMAAQRSDIVAGVACHSLYMVDTVTPLQQHCNNTVRIR
jgi:hypothetical protein